MRSAYKIRSRSSTSTDRAKIYAESGIWYDAINTLAQARRLEDTPELTALWEALLNSIALDDEVASAPLVDCCRGESLREKRFVVPATQQLKCGSF